MQKTFLYSVYLFCMLLVLTACGQTKEEQMEECLNGLYKNSTVLKERANKWYEFTFPMVKLYTCIPMKKQKDFSRQMMKKYDVISLTLKYTWF